MFTFSRRRGTRRFVPVLECLESRLAPATFVNATTITYQDVDGDTVTVKSTKPIFNASSIGTVLAFDQASAGNATPQQLQLIDLTMLANPASAGGTSLTITAARSAVHGGDGLVNVGWINATGIDLNAVTIHGDLGRIAAGDANTATPGLASLTVQSLGRFGTTTQAAAPAPDLVSNILGPLNSLTVKSDVVGEAINVTGGANAGNGRIGSIAIGGGLIGLNGQTNSGFISSSGNMGAVSIGGDVLGADGQHSGEIISQGTLKSVTIGGALIGGNGSDSGEISSSGNLGMVNIGGDILGGGGTDSGEVQSVNGTLAGITVGGSLVGGGTSGSSGSGEIFSELNMGPVLIKGSIVGGGASSSGEVDTDNGTIASVTVNGSLIGGGSGSTSDSGEIFSELNMGKVLIKGSIIGGAASLSGAVDTDVDSSIASVTVGGSLIGGAGGSSGLIVSGASIGPIVIGGDIRGGAGSDSGLIGPASGATTGTFASISVLGSLIGGGGQNSGEIFSLTGLAGVQIGQSVVGGTAQDSGEIAANGNITKVVIGDSLVGGAGSNSGVIDTAIAGNIGTVTIGGSVVGGSGSATTTGAIVAIGSLTSLTIGVNLVGGSITGSSVINLAQSGYVTADHIGSVTIGGSLIAGSNANTGVGSTFVQDGSIRAGHDIGSITVKGSLVGNSTNPVIISAVGQATVPAGSKTDLALGSLTVGGRVGIANILAGYDPTTNGSADGSTPITGAVNGKASIGKVKVGGDWLLSNLVAGAQPGADNLFGTADDAEIGIEAAEDLIAAIASILIGGQALGTPSAVNANDHYGFVAEDVVAFSLGGTAYKLQSGPSNDGPIAIGATGDMTLLEVT